MVDGNTLYLGYGLGDFRCNYNPIGSQKVAEVSLSLDQFNLSLVQAAVRGQALPEHEYSGIDVRLRTALATWLAQDLATYESCLQEEEFSSETGHGFLDLVLIRGSRCVVVDWKTTQGWDSPGWVVKKKLDPQTSWYLGYGSQHLQAKGLQIDYLEYRCLNDQGAYKTFQLQPSELHGRRIREQAEVLRETFLAMRSVTGPWLQHMPDACFLGSKGGQPTCRFYQECTTGSEPRLVLGNQHGNDKILDWMPRSKSAFKTFLRCPEQYRRTRLLGESGEDMGIEAKLGIAFHLGAGELWRQAFLNKK